MNMNKEIMSTLQAFGRPVSACEVTTDLAHLVNVDQKRLRVLVQNTLEAAVRNKSLQQIGSLYSFALQQPVRLASANAQRREAKAKRLAEMAKQGPNTIIRLSESSEAKQKIGIIRGGRPTGVRLWQPTAKEVQQLGTVLVPAEPKSEYVAKTYTAMLGRKCLDEENKWLAQLGLKGKLRIALQKDCCAALTFKNNIKCPLCSSPHSSSHHRACPAIRRATPSKPQPKPAVPSHSSSIKAQENHNKRKSTAGNVKKKSAKGLQIDVLFQKRDASSAPPKGILKKDEKPCKKKCHF